MTTDIQRETDFLPPHSPPPTPPELLGEEPVSAARLTFKPSSLIVNVKGIK